MMERISEGAIRTVSSFLSFETTSNYKSYLHYKEYKNAFTLNYKGIDLRNVVAYDLLQMIVFNKKHKILDHIYLLFLRIDANKLLSAFNNYDVIFSAFHDREDHKELLITDYSRLWPKKNHLPISTSFYNYGLIINQINWIILIFNITVSIGLILYNIVNLVDEKIEQTIHIIIKTLLALPLVPEYF